jgi:hypothetical protein
MIPYDIDPSLHPVQPTPEQLDDGFSPPRGQEQEPSAASGQEVDPALWAKSAF